MPRLKTYFDCSTSSRSRTSAYLHARRPLEIEDAVDALQHHRDALEAVGQLRRDRRQLHAARLLEVRELRNLLAVEHHLPADAPRAERRRLPVVFLEPDVVLPRIDAARFQALEIHLLHIVRRRLENDLKLMVLEQAVRVLAEAAVGRTPRRLHVRDVPVPGPEHAEKRLRMHRAGADLDVERLLQRAPARCPEFGQLENEVLKRQRRISRNTRADFRSFSRCIAISSRWLASSSRRTLRDTATSARPNGLHDPRRREKRLRPAGERRVGLVHALEPQQPVLEVARERFDRHAGRQRLDDRGAEPDTASRSDPLPAPTRRSARRSTRRSRARCRLHRPRHSPQPARWPRAATASAPRT